MSDEPSPRPLPPLPWQVNAGRRIVARLTDLKFMTSLASSDQLDALGELIGDIITKETPNA